MGVITELLSDDRGLVWPESVAPAKVYLARLGNIPSVISAADEIYDELTKQNIEVLYDDRDVRAGEKFADAELLADDRGLVWPESVAPAKVYLARL